MCERKTLLVVDGCIRRPQVSRTYALYQRFLQALGERYQVETITLREEDLQPYREPEVEKRNALQKAGAFDDPLYAYARQFAAADRILIAAPFWEGTFPSLLRIYLEHVSAAGVCFGYADNQPVGKCKAESLLYVTTVGGYAPHGKLLAMDFLADLCYLFGIPHLTSLSAEGLDIEGNDPQQILDNCTPRIEELAKNF